MGIGNPSGNMDAGLWGGIVLPVWDLERFYALYGQVRQGCCASVLRDSFTRMLMYQVAQHVRSRGWSRTLAQHRIEPEEAAAEVMRHLYAKILRIRLRNPCPKVLISTLNQAIDNLLKSVVRSHSRKTAMKMSQCAENADYADSRSVAPDLRGLAQAMREAEEGICQAICPDHPALRDAYRRLLLAVLSGKDAPTHRQLPRHLRAAVSADAFALLSYSVHERIRLYAADCSPEE